MEKSEVLAGTGRDSSVSKVTLLRSSLSSLGKTKVGKAQGRSCSAPPEPESREERHSQSLYLVFYILNCGHHGPLQSAGWRGPSVIRSLTTNSSFVCLLLCLWENWPDSGKKLHSKVYNCLLFPTACQDMPAFLAILYLHGSSHWGSIRNDTPGLQRMCWPTPAPL